MSKLFLFPLISISFFLAAGQNTTVDLNKNWRFRKQGDTQWMKATVPGTVHTNLMANKLIPDPFLDENEKKVQWIDKENWEYETMFNADSKTLTNKHIELVFNGLDTYADVYLNDKLILQADNMFRQWSVDIRPFIKKTGNILFIRFYSAQNKVDSIAKSKLPFVLPDNPRVYARKAQYSFGWDFAPKLTTCGIWRKIRLEGWDDINSKDITDANQRLTQQIKPLPVIKLIQQPDSVGTSFYFRVNGKPVYIKGANWVPADAFLPRVKKADYRRLLMMAKDAHINMLRVWGGGVYEDDYFYDLCDSLGIMVWQDFMFAGGMVPGDEHFFKNVREEIKYQVQRLKYHPCIALWCGNNEIDEAWHNWDWQQQFNLHGSDSAKVWNDYKRLFEDSIRLWVNQYDGTRPYLPSTPMHGWGRKESITEGDSHYWGVWWGLEDIEIFEKKTGRFVSEYGMQAMPNNLKMSEFENLKIKIPKEYINKRKTELYSSALKAHEKHPTGFENIKFYLNRYFLDSAKVDKLNISDYIYLTNCLQYYALKNSIAIHRSKYPVNMGTMVWQLNDCWPGVTWSIIDYDKHPKGGYYALKQGYRDDIIIKRDTILPKDIALTKPRFTVSVKDNQATIQSDRYAKYVYLYSSNEKLMFENNYFDLMPGEVKRIKYKGTVKDIKVISLYNLKSHSAN